MQRRFWGVVFLPAVLAVALATLLSGCENGKQGGPEALPEPSPNRAWVDIADAAGIEFLHRNGASEEKFLPETMGAGAAFFDMDNDEDADLLLIDSGPQSRLYENDGSGRYRDVTAGAGIPGDFHGQGVAVADYDGDGDVDLFLTAVGPNRLLRNDGGKFVEVTDQARVAGGDDAWSTSAGFVDYDLDGDLDLFVCNYVVWSQEIDRALNRSLPGGGVIHGSPNQYRGTHSYLYRNDGSGGFTDVSEAAGIQIFDAKDGEALGKALAVTFADLDGDRYPEILVANDMVQNFLYRNLGDGRFEEIGSVSGLGFDSTGFATSGMGIDVGHPDNDARWAVAVGNFANEMTSFHVQQEDPWLYLDQANARGIGIPSLLPLSFGLLFFDYDLDGWLDLLQTNGHVETDIQSLQPSLSYRQPTQLFRNEAGGDPVGFREIPEDESGDLARRIAGRAAAYADIDADGDLDLLLTESGGRPLLLRNDSSSGNHWLRIRLIDQGLNRDAIGAEAILEAGGAVQRRQVMPTRSYLAQVELPLTFGLGSAQTVERLTVVWPDGVAQEVFVGEIDRTLLVRRGG